MGESSKQGSSKAQGGNKKRGGSRSKKEERGPKVSTTKREAVEIEQLEARIAEESPEPGSVDIAATEFSELPVSRYTLNGLQKGKYAKMTQVQRVAIPHALAGRDILGAAKTGSGKTLAFVVPMLERLYRTRWSSNDGLGGLIISPTRELAMQIFEVLRAVGSSHYSLSAGLITGGKDFQEEQEAIGAMSILVATPGRLLQHLEQTPGFEVGSLQCLILDEADRLLDMGFSDTLNSILTYLPSDRQTLLFSATQTKNVSDLARLSLRNPEYVAVHERAETATPARLSQHYVVCKLEDKMNMLYSFIRSHLQNKTIVFVSSCKLARYMFEVFRRLRPGVPLQLLHGKMKQSRRMLVYYDYLKKPSAVLFATDIAARGLDFPSVDWVLQLDCPEDIESYIHRAGRTARFKSKGHSLLVLTPTESEAMVPKLKKHNIPIVQTRINPNAAISITGKIAAEVAADAQLKELAQKAFASYLRSVYLQKDKEVFQLSSIPVLEYSASLGLANPPQVSIVKKHEEIKANEGKEIVEEVEAERTRNKEKKNANKSLDRLREKIAAEREAKRKAREQRRKAKMGAASQSDESSANESSHEKGADSAQGSEEEDELFSVKRADRKSDEDSSDDSDFDGEDKPMVTEEELAGLTEWERAKILRVVDQTKLLAKEASERGKNVVTPFQRIAMELAKEKGIKAPDSAENLQAAAAKYTAEVAARLQARKEADRRHERERIRQKRQEEKARLRGERDGADAVGAQLGGYSDNEDEEHDDDDGSVSGSVSGSESGSYENDSDVDSGSDDEDGERHSGRKRSYSSDEDSSSDDSDNKEPDVADLEAQALAMMAKRRKA